MVAVCFYYACSGVSLDGSVLGRGIIGLRRAGLANYAADFSQAHAAGVFLRDVVDFYPNLRVLRYPRIGGAPRRPSGDDDVDLSRRAEIAAKVWQRGGFFGVVDGGRGDHAVLLLSHHPRRRSLPHGY